VFWNNVKVLILSFPLPLTFREERGQRERGETRTQAGTPKERGDERRTPEREKRSLFSSHVNNRDEIR
jgi:hypothetical protein